MIVTDNGFKDEDEGVVWLDLTADDPLPSSLPDAIRIRFGSFADGRGFTIARQLRAQGFSGRLRASGPLIADQYAMARRSGFDEVEITPEMALRQPESQWRARADWKAHDYQARLGGRA